MIFAEIVLGAPQWAPWATVLAALAIAAVVWGYLRSTGPVWTRLLAALLKTTGIVLLAVCLVDPLFTGERPRPGSNLFLVLADNSRSLELATGDAEETRAAAMHAELEEDSPWLARLGQDFDVRRYGFDSSLQPVKEFADLKIDGDASALTTALASLGERYRNQPVAGILVFTDGAATDIPENGYNFAGLPPIYPAPLGEESAQLDLSVSRVSVTQTNFEAAPVTLTAEIVGQSVAGRKVALRVVDATGKELERRIVGPLTPNEPLAQRFLIRPENPGVSFYTVTASLEGEEDLLKTPGASEEATLANNRRMATVDRGGGPYRVLYMSGRANWEFKFLRRALEEDDEVNLVGLVRVAKKEPKFTFLSRSGERTNPLFRGFGNDRDEAAEQYDEPVLIRLGTEDKDELRGGFPKDAEELFRYHAVIIDDMESAAFTQDQQSLLQQFVSQRGGGFLMLAGHDSFAEGGYQRTPIAEMLPVYLDRLAPQANPAGARLALTREGWLQPWVRLRANEQDEDKRLAEMPAFKSLNRVNSIKPGAAVLAHVESGDVSSPALVVQEFGRGRAAALLVGDLWRWHLRREEGAESDLEKSWRQTVRWLVADVPGAVEVQTRRPDGSSTGMELVIRARDKMYKPLDNASVAVRVTTPDDRVLNIIAEASDRAAGEYVAMFAAREPGAYIAHVAVTAADGSPVGERDAGWTVEPDTEEFRTLAVNRPLLDAMAKQSGGEVISMNSLDAFVRSLPNRKIPIVEKWTYPLWHQWTVFALALGCFMGEWGLRRLKGMA